MAPGARSFPASIPVGTEAEVAFNVERYRVLDHAAYYRSILTTPWLRAKHTGAHTAARGLSMPVEKISGFVKTPPTIPDKSSHSNAGCRATLWA